MKFPGKIRKTAACFLLFCIVLACIPVHAEENEAVEISAPSGVLMEPETKTKTPEGVLRVSQKS